MTSKTYKGRRIPLNSSDVFENAHNRDILRDAYKSLVAALPHRAAAIRAAMAAARGLSNAKTAALLETVAHEHFGSTAEAAMWCRGRKLRSFQGACQGVF